MRIAKAISLYLPEFQGGAALVCHRLAEELVALGHTASVFCGRATAAVPTGAVQRERVGSCATWRVNAGGAFDAWEPEGYWHPLVTRAFADFLAETRPDVVHSHSLQGIGAGLVAAAAQARIPVVVTMHDWWWLCPCLFRLSPRGEICPPLVRPELCSGRSGYDFETRRAVLTAALSSVSRIIVPSAFLRDSLTENGIGGGKILVQENGVPRPAARARTPAADRPGPLRFAFFGGAGNQAKGLSILLDAACLLADADFVLECHSVTAEEASPWAERVGAHLRLRPPFAPKELDEVLAATDVVVLPSLMRESFSLVAREALMRGVPVVTTDSGGPQEVVRDGENGLVVDSASPSSLATGMRRLIEDRPLLRRLEAATPLATITPRDQALACEAIYRDVLSETQTRRPTPARRRLAGRRILFLSGIDGAPLRYRVWNLVERLRLGGVQSRVLFHSDVAALEAARWADLVVLFRAPYSATVASVVAEARRRAVPVVFSVDDLVFRTDVLGEAPALEHPRAEVVSGYLQSVEAYARSCAAADYFIGSTETLAKAAADLGLPSYVLENGLSRALIELSERALGAREAHVGDELRVGFLSGTDTHDADLAMIAEPLAWLLRRHANIRLVLGGPVALPGALSGLGSKVERWPFVAWSDLPAKLAALDVSLAPLDLSRPFNRAKSAIKVLEAAAAGVPSVASDGPELRRATRNGATGLLCDSTEAWERSLERIVEHAPLREALAQSARRDVLARYSAEAQVDDVLDAVADMLERGPRSTKPLPDPVEMEAGDGSSVALEPDAARYDCYSLDADAGEPLGAQRSVEQSFRCQGDGLWRIDVLVGTYARRNDHEVHLTLHDEKGEKLAERRCPAVRLVDRQFVSLELDEPLRSAGRELSLRAEAPGAGPGNEILLWQGSSPIGGLRIAGRDVPGRSLAFRAFAEACA